MILNFSLFLSFSISIFGYNNMKFMKKYYNKFNKINKNYALNNENFDYNEKSIENYENYWPLRKNFYEEYIKKLNSKNITIQNNAILDKDGIKNDENDKNYKNDSSQNTFYNKNLDWGVGGYGEQDDNNEEEEEDTNNFNEGYDLKNNEINTKKKRQIIIVSGNLKDLNLDKGLDLFEAFKKYGEANGKENTFKDDDNDSNENTSAADQEQGSSLHDQELVELIRGLKLRLSEVNAEYQKSDHLIQMDTIGKARRKQRLETQITMLKRDIERLERTKVVENSYMNPNNDDSPYEIVNNRIRSKRGNNIRETKSENFEVVKNMNITFKNVGGYENIKSELNQCIDILKNYKKYSKYNVRIPKGLILEGPPGNGKTLLAKAFAGESNTSFIAVSGSQFQEKYVGVGATRIRELFDLAKKNIPCIIFIDEIDAVGRKRSTDGETSSSERDSTLNELLVQLDGFNTKNGIFLMGATNRADLLDPALLRPGRIDKRIFINLPDPITREAILNIHLKGKPYDKSINITDLVDLTTGLSGAQIENLLNEAMLNALRLDHDHMVYKDIDTVINKIIAGWQPTEHQLTTDIIDKIAIHEMGHAIVGFLSKSHTKVSKVIINLSSPTSPGYTIFETSKSNIYTRESLFEHLMILLAGRIAEEVFYDTASTTTGAMDDLNKAFELAEKMIIHYGMGKKLIYPNLSNKYKEMIDDEVINLINEAYAISSFIIKNSKELIWECSEILKNNKLLKVDEINHLVNTKYPKILDLQIKF